MQVALLCGLDEEAKKELIKGPAHGGEHLNKLLKFLSVRTEKGRERTGIALLGGAHDAKLDGANPARCVFRNKDLALLGILACCLCRVGRCFTL